jgi:hypothetical protein
MPQPDAMAQTGEMPQTDGGTPLSGLANRSGAANMSRK